MIKKKIIRVCECGVPLVFFVYNALNKTYIHQSRPLRAGLAEKQPGRNFMLRLDYQF